MKFSSIKNFLNILSVALILLASLIPNVSALEGSVQKNESESYKTSEEVKDEPLDEVNAESFSDNSSEKSKDQLEAGETSESAIASDTIESDYKPLLNEPSSQSEITEDAEEHMESKENVDESIIEEEPFQIEAQFEEPSEDETIVNEELLIKDSEREESVYSRQETFDLAMEMMKEDLFQKSNATRMRSFSSGISHVDSFINTIAPSAVKDSTRSKILASITLAQGALESAWGLSVLAVDANNLFGIKSSSDWKGDVYTIITKENLDGKWYEVVDTFRKYPSWSASIEDHADFFTSTEWRKNNYRYVIGEKDYRKAAQALQDAGYATDPGYASKLISIIETYKLYLYDELPTIQADYHVEKHGWLKTSGTKVSLGHAGDDLRVEDIRLSSSMGSSLGFTYSAHIEKKGWINNISSGASIGNEGKALRMEAVKIQLNGSEAINYDVYYRVYSDTIGWSGWAKNGSPAGSEGYAKKIRSIEIMIASKNESPVSISANAYKVYQNPSVVYLSQLQYDGWTANVKDGVLSGTTGKARRLEAFKLSLENSPYVGNIEYTSHAQSYGWLPYVSNGKVSGTVGEGKRLEAIKVQLTGPLSEEFDIYYRTHIEKRGWTGWAKNGAPSGSEGLAYRMEALQIKIVKKGSKAPGVTTNTFYK